MRNGRCLGLVLVLSYLPFAHAAAATSGKIDQITTVVSSGSVVGVAADAAGNIYYCDVKVHRIDAVTGTDTTVAGNGNTSFSGDGGPATSAGMDPYDLTFDANGNLYVIDYNHRIRRVDAATGIISTVAGNGVEGFSGDGGPATSATIRALQGIAIDGSGNLIFADSGNNRVRKVNLTTGIITTIAGGDVSNATFNNDGSLTKINDGGPATSAFFFNTSGLALDSSGNIYIADSGDNRIRKIDAATGIISSIITGLDGPSGLAFDKKGNFYFCDGAYSHPRVCKAAAGGGGFVTVAGNGRTSGFNDAANGDGGPATKATIDAPGSVAVDTAGNLFIVDGSLRKVTIGVTAPAIITSLNATPNPAKAGQTITFSATIGKTTGTLTGTFDFGDGSAPVQLSGDIATALKGTLSHTYSSEGIYKTVLSLDTGTPTAAFLYVAVGRDSAVNPINGVVVKSITDSSGSFSLSTTIGGITSNGNALITVDPSKVPGAVTATTYFSNQQTGAAGFDGLTVVRSFNNPGVYVATSYLFGASGGLGSMKKTISVGARATGDPSGLPPPPSNEIKMQKLSSRFSYHSNTPVSKNEQLTFSGTIQLPAGYNPAATGGNKLMIGAGTYVNYTMLDAKGQVDKGFQGITEITKVSLQAKLSGPAQGGEVAKLSFTISTPEIADYWETEGIRSTFRNDEMNFSAVSRFFQINLVLAGVEYNAYVPILFKVAKNGAAGSISGSAKR